MQTIGQFTQQYRMTIQKDSPALADYPAVEVARPVSEFFASFEANSNTQRLALAAVIDWTKQTANGECAGLVLWSTRYGVGKTHLARCAHEALGWAGKRGTFATAPDWLENIKATYNDGGGTERDLFRQWEGGYFAMDDYGKQYQAGSGEWAQEKFFKLMDKCYGRQSLMITSNSKPDEMRLSLGGAAWSRLYGMCHDAGFVNMSDLPDWRAR